MSGTVWMDGAYLPAAEARLPALSRAVLYGEGLFETLRIYAGRPYGLERHLARLTASARVLGIPLTRAIGVVAEVARGLVERNTMAESVLRITLLAGVGEEAHLVCALRALPEGLEREQAEGIDVSTARAGSLPLAAHKTTSYLRYLAAARSAGTRETILLDDDDRVLEGCRSNVFAILGDELVTPPADGRVLPGITRALTLEIAASAGLVARERPLERASLPQTRAMMVTNSVMEIVPVRTVDGVAVGLPGGGPVALLQRRYRELVRAG